jgi:hypothetical protein
VLASGRTPSQGYGNAHTGSFGQHDGRAKGIRIWSSRAIVISLAANLSVREETRKAERLRAGKTKPRPVLRLLVLVLHNTAASARAAVGLPGS